MAVHVRIELDDAVLQQAIRDLGLTNPPRFRLNAPEAAEWQKKRRQGNVVEHRGRFTASDNRVDIISSHASARKAPLSHVVTQIKKTVLHELRHAWQRQEWDEETKEKNRVGPYELRGEEIDANEYADANVHRYPGLVKVVRKGSGRSGFARMADHERSRP